MARILKLVNSFFRILSRGHAATWASASASTLAWRRRRRRNGIFNLGKGHRVMRRTTRPRTQRRVFLRILSPLIFFPFFLAPLRDQKDEGKDYVMASASERRDTLGKQITITRVSPARTATRHTPGIGGGDLRRSVWQCE